MPPIQSSLFRKSGIQIQTAWDHLDKVENAGKKARTHPILEFSQTILFVLQAFQISDVGNTSDSKTMYRERR